MPSGLTDNMATGTLTVAHFTELLTANPGVGIHFMLPDEAFVPAHAHITEMGVVRKDFVDCGGTVRAEVTCTLQLWVATDTDHRLTTTTLQAIVRAAKPLLPSQDLPIMVEYEAETLSVYPLAGAEVTPAGILFHLGKKHAECLAPDRCGVGSGCC